MGSTGTGSSSTEPGGTAGANKAQTTSGAYTAPGTATMPGSKGTAGAPADPNSANPSGMGTGTSR
jgi:hypothetical protein